MRRQDIQLLALARQGDIAARCEAGRRYLLGTEGFPHHVPTGLDYLNQPNVKRLPQAARIIAESLSLEALLRLDQQEALAQAAAAGSAVAQAKLGAWLGTRRPELAEGARWLDAAAAQGHEGARKAVAAARKAQGRDATTAMLKSFAGSHELDAPAIAVIAARQALASGELERMTTSLHAALALSPAQATAHMDDELAELVSAAVRLAESSGRSLDGLAPAALEAALDHCTTRGDRDAAYALGRALCGIACGPLEPAGLVEGSNMRKGVALLLRAADAGCEEAWLHLYRVHGNHRLSVANPQMARFCLEKAALGGQVEAQRKLGALILRASNSLGESEQAIQWLHAAAAAHDTHAQGLLQSLVLPLQGNDDEARSAIELVRREDPWLAVRLQLSREFGLTKLEALCTDPAEGLRPWGLVVGKNPFISQIRLSAARAIPALTDQALETLRRAAQFFGQASRDALAFEGDLRRRSLRQRRVFDKLGLDESMFFANATSMTLEALRLGPKWAFRAREPLQLALAA